MSFKSFIDSFAHGLGFGMLYGNPYLSCCSNPFMYNPYMCGSISLFAYPSINTMNFFPQTPVFSQPEFNFSFDTGGLNMPANYNTGQTGLFNFNFSNIGNTTNLSAPASVRSSSNVGDTFTSTTSKSVINASNNAVKNIDWWKKQGYNEAKGKEFAKNAKMISDEMQRNGIKGNCVGGVRNAINKTFYNGETKYSRFGKAYQVGDKYLSKDKNFKKIDIRGLNLSPKDIPAGAIILYAPGYSNGKGKTCGHGEVSFGDGCGYSDVKTSLLSNYGNRRDPQEIWIPV